MDTVGEFPQATDQPESGQVGDTGAWGFRSPGGPDELANSIGCYLNPYLARKVGALSGGFGAALRMDWHDR
jgi:hypothetical protein